MSTDRISKILVAGNSQGTVNLEIELTTVQPGRLDPFTCPDPGQNLLEINFTEQAGASLSNIINCNPILPQETYFCLINGLGNPPAQKRAQIRTRSTLRYPFLSLNHVEVREITIDFGDPAQTDGELVVACVNSAKVIPHSIVSGRQVYTLENGGSTDRPSRTVSQKQLTDGIIVIEDESEVATLIEQGDYFFFRMNF